MDETVNKFVGLTKRQFIVLLLLVAFLTTVGSTTILAIRAHDNKQEIHTVGELAKKVEANSERSCAAIQGAIAFWRLVLASTEEALTDPQMSPVVRRSNLQFAIALRDVIKKGSALNC